jgi:hypothetical protein
LKEAYESGRGLALALMEKDEKPVTE